MWTKQFGNAGNDEKATGVAITPHGTIVVTGHITDAFDFGAGPESCGQGRDVFVLELTAAGEPVRSDCYGGSGVDEPEDIDIVGDGLVLTGFFEDDLDFGAPTLQSEGKSDVFVAFLRWP